MASNRQIEANRRNAKRSTGPRTEQGKTRSSRNALRHGLSRSSSGTQDADWVLVTAGLSISAPDFARIKAELAHIRAVRYSLLEVLSKNPDLKVAKRLSGLDRYERQALARQKR